MVGGANAVLIVLDHQHGIAQVAEFEQRVDEPRVVALVQADGWLIEYVTDADELAADLRRESDALRLAAGKRASLSVQVQVVEADVVEEAEPIADFLDDRLGDAFTLGGQFKALEELDRDADVHLRYVIDREAGQRGMGYQPILLRNGLVAGATVQRLAALGSNAHRQR